MSISWAAKSVKMAVYEIRKLPNLISRKIWAAVKSSVIAIKMGSEIFRESIRKITLLFKILGQIKTTKLLTKSSHLVTSFYEMFHTMLQKLSKCEVEAWLCWSFTILPPHRFYVKSNLGDFKRSKNGIFGNFRGSQFWF